ncbi:chemotaxis protein [Vibrio azureus]|uniref:methyl-accepting chemotaxis protein n=1 Tax=Vibrio azureus TaxID=512649 RepID=UPI000C7ACA06|nr:methyl-accepting chemotaxis protein [Vibrio azureus]AUI86080.1 chemotaxis protein [Vibrio azureus]
MSAKLKIIFSIMAMTLVLIMTTSFLSWKNFEGSSTTSFKKQLDYKSQLIADAIEQKISRYFDVLSLTSTELVFDEYGNVDIPSAVDILHSAKNIANVNNVYFSTADGTSYSSKTNGIIPNFNALSKQREWFIDGMNGKDTIITRPYQASTGDTVMALAKPIYREGKVVGVIALNLLLDDLTKFTQQLTTSNKIFVSRGDGFILAAQDSGLVGKNIFSQIPLFKSVDTSKEESFEYTYNGVEYLGSAAELSSLNWSVWAWMTEEEVNADSNDNLTSTLLTSSLFLIASILCVYFIVDLLIYKPIGGEPKEIENIVSQIAKGDLTQTSTESGKNTGVNGAISEMSQDLKATINTIRHSSDELMSFAQGISQVADNVNDSSSSQMEQLEQTSTAMNEMAVAVNEVAQNAQRASDAAIQASQEAASGNQVFEEVNNSIVGLSDAIADVSLVINNLGDKTVSIGAVLDVIRDIAEQTNLLALNAAIEAARAGEQGRGFAVVADEVRNLANRTQESTNEIQQVITALQQEANNSIEMMQANRTAAELTLNNSSKAQRSLAEISNSIAVIEDMNTQIATATEEQTLVTGEINQSIVNINDKARETLELSSSNQEKSTQLIDLSNKLTQTVSTFKLS